MTSRRKPTTTSSFGVSRRESHDASGFYARFSAPRIDDDDLVDPHKEIDEIFCANAESMPQVPDRSVALVVTSPPYFAGKEYEEAIGEGHIPATYLEYLAMLETVFAECVRTLEPGGRIAVNVANLGRRPYRSLSSDVVGVLEGLGLLLRGEVIWRKAQGSTGSCAWGSFQRPGNPVLRDLTERVVVASKGRFDRAISAREREVRGLPCVASLSKDEFMEATTDVWELPSERATVVGHPAPFPVALPERLIHLYTYRGDLVLDPFMGSGTTAVAAVRTGRHFVGFDTDADYVDRAQARVEDERVRLASTDGRPPAAFATPALPPAPSPTGADEDQFTRALREGGAAKDVAKALLECCGFTGVRADVRFPGLTVSFRALDAAEQPWLFDVVGGFTSTAPGLRRAEAFWRALGKAAVVHEIEPEVPLVLLTSAAPLKNTPAEAALRAVTGPGQAVRAVVCIGTPRGRDDLERLVAEEVATSAAPR